jgi:hypothetical protein
MPALFVSCHRFIVAIDVADRCRAVCGSRRYLYRAWRSESQPNCGIGEKNLIRY